MRELERRETARTGTLYREAHVPNLTLFFHIWALSCSFSLFTTTPLCLLQYASYIDELSPSLFPSMYDDGDGAAASIQIFLFFYRAL